MKLLENEDDTDVDNEYLGTMLSIKNDWSRKIGIIITKAEKASFGPHF